MDRIRTDHRTVKKLGHWTTAREFEVQARRGAVVLDLRSARIPAGAVEIRVDLDHALVKLLVPDGAVVDTEDLRWFGGGRVKDWTGTPDPNGRRIRLVGAIRDGEVRVHRGGIAALSALFSREFVEDCRRANRLGIAPTVVDPS